jgi:hypothetical protein
MSITEIKLQLHEFIEQADERKIKGLFLLIEDEIGHKKGITFSEEEITFLDAEYSEHLKNEGQSYNWEEAKRIIRG